MTYTEHKTEWYLPRFTLRRLLETVARFFIVIFIMANFTAISESYDIEIEEGTKIYYYILGIFWVF